MTQVLSHGEDLGVVRRRWSGVSTFRAKYVAVASDPLTAAPTTAAIAVLDPLHLLRRPGVDAVGGTPAMVSGAAEETMAA